LPLTLIWHMSKKVIILSITISIICIFAVYLGVKSIFKNSPSKRGILNTLVLEKKAKKAAIKKIKGIYEAPTEGSYDPEKIIFDYKKAAINNDGKRAWQIIRRVIELCKKDEGFCSDIVSSIQLMLFNGETLETRQYAALLLSQIGNQQAISLLIDAAMVDPGNIGRYLAEMKNKEAVPILVSELRNGPSPISKYLTMALANIGSEDAVSELIDLLRTDDPTIREQAGIALRQVQNGEAVPVLKRLLIEKGPYGYKKIGIDALTHIGDGRATAALVDIIKEVKDDNLKSEICASLSRIHRPDGIRIIEGLALKERDPYIRRWAVIALGQHRKMLPLLRQIAKNDNSARVRKAALKQINILQERRKK